MSRLAIDGTRTVSVIGADPEQVVSVTMGDLETLLDDGMDVEAGFIGINNVTIHERTCHDTLPATWDTFECSECGTQWAVSPVYIGPDGTTEHDMEKPSYCPNCGARVVVE